MKQAAIPKLFRAAGTKRRLWTLAAMTLFAICGALATRRQRPAAPVREGEIE